MYMESDGDSPKFFKTLVKAQMFWYNPNILSDQAW